MYRFAFKGFLGGAISMACGELVLRKATLDDIESLLILLSTGRGHGLQRLTLVPDGARRQVICSEIGQGRLWVAVDRTSGAIVAMRKIFIVEDQAELHEILTHVLRCTHNERKLFECGFFNHSGEFIKGAIADFVPNHKTLYLYVGSAFTHFSYRGKRINEQLNAYAYAQLQDSIYRNIQMYSYERLALLYFLVEENYWRKGHLARPFLQFAQGASEKFGQKASERALFYAYKMYKPDFALDAAGRLVRLPDEQCRVGRGCVLLYDFMNG